DTNYVYKIDEFEFINGIFKTCQYFLSINYQIIVVTNQSGIARGYFIPALGGETCVVVFTSGNYDVLAHFSEASLSAL
ncbi:MAG: hypothetical protein P8Q98_08125, partial [Candidatus Poseidoniaceae archaeon]|nr:hypothetical protein [Candidatus Poseidoniaceae archaeon]